MAFYCNCNTTHTYVGRNKEPFYIHYPCPTHKHAPELYYALKDLLNALPVGDVIPNTDAAQYIDNAKKYIELAKPVTINPEDK